MLFKIIIKNFKYNLKNYVLFFAGELMAIAMLFTFLSLKDSLSRGIFDSVIRYVVDSEFKIAAAIIIVISIFIMVFSMKYYMKVRVRDYGMFLTLGMKRKMVFLMLLTESGAGIFMSLVVGLVFGNGLLYGCQKVLGKIDSTYHIHMNVPFAIYRNTVLLSLVIMAAALFSIMVMIGEKNVSDLAEDKQKEEIRPKGKWLVLTAVGIILCIAGIYVYKKDNGVGPYRAIIIWAISIFFLLYFGVGLFLEFLKKRQRFYFRNLLHLSQLYHQYSSNYLIMYGLALIHFMAIGYLAGQIAESLPLTPDAQGYPYDAVWCAAEKDGGYIKDFEEKYNVKAEQYPMFMVTGRNTVQQIGISESTYEAITGHEISLKGDEILYADQYIKYLDRESKKGILSMTDIIHIGRYHEEFGTYAMSGDQYNKEEYRKTNIKELVVQPAVGKYSMDGWHSNVLVFSDDYFEKEWKQIRQARDEQNLLVLMHIPEAVRESAAEDLMEYENREGIKNDVYTIEVDNLTVTDHFLEGLKMQNTFNFASRIIIILALIISCLFLIGLKGFSTMEFYRRQDAFFYCMGMKRGRRRKTVKKEIYSSIKIPLLFGGGMGLVYLGCYGWIFEPAKYGDYTYWKTWAFVFAIYIIVIVTGALLLSHYLVRKMEEETKHERY